MAPILPLSKMTDSSGKTFVATIVGLSLGIATLDMERLSLISPNPILGLFQEALIFALVPGLIPSVAVGSLWIGLVVNAICYFGLSWAVCSLWQSFRRKHQTSDTSSIDPLV
jgi:hypothetical protein